MKAPSSTSFVASPRRRESNYAAVHRGSEYRHPALYASFMFLNAAGRIHSPLSALALQESHSL